MKKRYYLIFILAAVAVKTSLDWKKKKRVLVAETAETETINQKKSGALVLTETSKNLNNSESDMSRVSEDRIKHSKNVGLSEWKRMKEETKQKKFQNREEVVRHFTEKMNLIYVDDSLTPEQRILVKQEWSEMESEMANEFPVKKIIGFKKELQNPADPGSGYKVSDITE